MHGGLGCGEISKYVGCVPTGWALRIEKMIRFKA